RGDHRLHIRVERVPLRADPHRDAQLTDIPGRGSGPGHAVRDHLERHGRIWRDRDGAPPDPDGHRPQVHRCGPDLRRDPRKMTPAIYLNGATLMTTPTQRVLEIARQVGYAGIEGRAERLLADVSELHATAEIARPAEVLALNGVALTLHRDGRVNRDI